MKVFLMHFTTNVVTIWIFQIPPTHSMHKRDNRNQSSNKLLYVSAFVLYTLAILWQTSRQNDSATSSAINHPLITAILSLPKWITCFYYSGLTSIATQPVSFLSFVAKVPSTSHYFPMSLALKKCAVYQVQDLMEYDDNESWISSMCSMGFYTKAQY